MNIPNRKSKEVTERYGVERNTFKRAVKANKERRIDLEIGDSKSDDFKPQVKTSWFGNEYNRSIRAAEHPSAKVRTSGNKIIYKTPEYDVVQYEKPDAGEEGGHELEWVLKKKPKSNVLPFTLRYKGDVRFHFQPPLTQEEKDNGATRPENVENSYAVYIDKANHKVGGNNYATGKIEHIYRPKAIDADGNEVWCELNIPEEGEAETNIACNVTVPQSFLDKASYPVTVDPTFGYETIGGSGWGYNYSDGDYAALGLLISPPEDAQVDSISAVVYQRSGHSTDPDFRSIITTSDAGQDLKVSTVLGQVPSSLSGFQTLSSTASSLNINDENKRIGVQVENRGFNFAYDDIGTRSLYFDSSETLATGINEQFTWSFDENGSRRYSLYVTYTAISDLTVSNVSTDATNNIGETSANLNGEIIDTGGEGAAESRGFVYDTTSYSNPGNVNAGFATNYNNVQDDFGNFSSGTFSASVSNLSSDTTYYVRAFAENVEGWSYGNEVEFTTNTASPSNTAPTANDDSETTAYETTVNINVLSNDTDPEGDTLTVDAITVQASNGTAVIQGDDTITYTPDNGFSGQDTFTYQISDTASNTDTAVVTVTVNPPPAPARIDGITQITGATQINF